MPGKRATSRVERAIMLLTALKPDRMDAERARLLNKEQRRPFIFTHSLRDQSVRSDFLRITPPTKRQKSFALSARVPSFERDRPPGGPPLVTPQLNGGPARRAVKNTGALVCRGIEHPLTPESGRSHETQAKQPDPICRRGIRPLAASLILRLGRCLLHSLPNLSPHPALPPIARHSLRGLFPSPRPPPLPLPKPLPGSGTPKAVA